MRKTGLILLALIFFSFSSENENNFLLEDYLFPKVKHPQENLPTAERIELGKKLFFDSILSKDSSISCASCHLPSVAFSDSIAFSLGVENRLGVRNAPSLFNVAYHPFLNRDGGVSTLEKQVLVPIQEHVEMDFNILKIADRMLKDSSYYNLSIKAYGRYPDPFVITRALACYERTLISSNSGFDLYLKGIRKFNQHEKNGMKLFFSEKAKCSSCHGGFNFTNYTFENNGIAFQYSDSGRMRITKKETDRALFKVPSLRNIELTAPYMHDGSIYSLEEVINHYSEGVMEHKNNKKVNNLNLDKSEKASLLAFLKTLTDTSLIKH